MIKKLLSGIFFITILAFTPFFELELSSESGENIVSEIQPEIQSEAAPAAVPLESATSYPSNLITSVGTLTYYNQADPLWADYMYGGSDSIRGYACGPTALAMIVSSFTEQTLTPLEMAQWADSMNYRVPGSGSRHSLIMEGAAAFGLHAEPLQTYTVDSVKSSLNSGHILVALMGPGHFTDSGHFIIITNYWANDQVTVADPASAENTLVPWDISLILNELHFARDSGAPLWAISPN